MKYTNVCVVLICLFTIAIFLNFGMKLLKYHCKFDGFDEISKVLAEW